ncbi:hypothetical protein GCM10009838_09720 [Catenulispora subtropica]|uniref:non-specific serine/threonine protein kinase n=1 Tax=Catenulispora subtropica TaxID=450798 RepID=A0ABP5C2D1_9ACTN
MPGYTETASLGSGATGRVVSAVEDATGVPVAIKYLSGKFLDDEAFLERFRAEAELLAGLDHPNVVRFHRYVEAFDAPEAAAPEAAAPEVPAPEAPATPDPAAATVIIDASALSEEADAPDGADAPPTASDGPVRGAALVMELVEGATLRRVLKSRGPVSPEAALSIMRGSLLGLDAAHGLGIVHRDYKPSNVLLTTDGVSKLADFGIAEKAGTEMPAIGTPSYMAPEQWEGAPAEPVTDIYAVTASFYECLTGHVPYAADTVFELEELHRTAPIPLADVPPAVRGLVAHGLAKEAGLRPADVSTFIAELEEAAISEYGVEWEEQGRRDLAVFVWPLSSGSAGGGSGGPAGPEQGGGAFPQPDGDFFDGIGGPEEPEGFEEDPGRSWKRVGRGTKAGLAAAAVAVIGSALAAMAFGSDTTGKAPVAGSTGITVSAPSSASLSGTPSSTLAAGTNAPTPGTPTPTSPTTTSSSTKPTPTLKTLTSSSSLNILPPASPPSSAGVPTPTGPAPSSPSSPSSAPTSPAPTTPTSSSSTPAPVTIVAQLELVKSAPAQPCPPADLPTYRVTFTVRGLPAGTTIPISYSWRLQKAGTGGKGSLNAGDGASSGDFSVGARTTRSISDSVVVTWNADGQSGTTNSQPVDIYCEVIG